MLSFTRNDINKMRQDFIQQYPESEPWLYAEHRPLLKVYVDSQADRSQSNTVDDGGMVQGYFDSSTPQMVIAKERLFQTLSELQFILFYKKDIVLYVPTVVERYVKRIRNEHFPFISIIVIE